MEGTSILERDLVCLRCGYNLRGLTAEGKCPECGTGVARSLAGGSLAAANGRWRNGMAMGAGLMAAGIVVYVGLQVVRGQGYESLEWTGRIIALSLVLTLMGLWLLTEREPDAVALERRMSPRVIARWGLLAASVMFVAISMLELRHSMFALDGGVGRFVILAVAGSVFPLLWFLAMHVAGLARRANRPALARAWWLMAWAGLASGVLLLFPLVLFYVWKINLPGSELRTVLLILPVISAMVVLAGMMAWTAWGLWQAKADAPS